MTSRTYTADIAALSDVNDLAKKDADVQSLQVLLWKILHKYGAMLTMRIVAKVLSPYKMRKFEKAFSVHAYRGGKWRSIPSDLTGKDIEEDPDLHLDHRELWMKDGKAFCLTSEPYYINKKALKRLIEHCDMYGIDFQIDAESFYYPGHTVRILFKKDYVSRHDAMAQMEDEPF